MTSRTTLSLRLSLVIALAVGCDLGVYDHTGDGAPPADPDAEPGSPDAAPGSPDAAPGSPDAAPGSPDAAPGSPDANTGDCDDVVSSVPSGYHKKGQPCLPCHDVAVGSLPAFTMAGTLYTDSAGSTTIAGATVHALDNLGHDITMVTTDNGNFWSTDSVSFPVTVRASMCPDNASMISSVSSSGADCNTSGCHGAGSRIHLP